MTDDDVCGYAHDDGECQLPASRSDGRCHHHTEADEQARGGRPSKFEDHRDEILEAAREPIKTRDVARTAGVGKSTLYDWLDEYEDFSDAFKRARSEAARDLVERGLEDPDTDSSIVRFLLERTFDYIKTQEVEHRGDGITINVPDDATDY